MLPTEITLDYLVNRTEAVAEAIRSGEWQLASDLEVERRELLKHFVAAEKRSHGGLEHLRQDIETLIICNNQFLGEIHHHRRTILREASTVRRGRDAAAEYDRQQAEN